MKFAPKTFFSLIKKLFKSIKKGTIPVPLNISRNLLDKVIRAKNSEKVVLQNGTGILTILRYAIPAIASLVPEIVKLFKKK